jgi:hypothetical protein
VSKDEGSNTANVRASHGGTAENSESSVIGIPSTQYVTSRGKEGTATTIVGEVGADVNLLFSISTNISGTDSDGGRSAGRRANASISVFVTSCNNNDDTSSSASVDGIVYSLVKSTSERKVGTGRLLGLTITRGIVNTGDNSSE